MGFWLRSWSVPANSAWFGGGARGDVGRTATCLAEACPLRAVAARRIVRYLRILALEVRQAWRYRTACPAGRGRGP